MTALDPTETIIAKPAVDGELSRRLRRLDEQYRSAPAQPRPRGPITPHQRTALLALLLLGCARHRPGLRQRRNWIVDAAGALVAIEGHTISSLVDRGLVDLTTPACRSSYARLTAQGRAVALADVTAHSRRLLGRHCTAPIPPAPPEVIDLPHAALWLPARTRPAPRQAGTSGENAL